MAAPLYQSGGTFDYDAKPDNTIGYTDYTALDRYYGDEVRRAKGEIDAIRNRDTAAQRQVMQTQQAAQTQMGNVAASGGASPMLVRAAQMRGDEGKQQAGQQRNMVQANELAAANQAMYEAQVHGGQMAMGGLGREVDQYGVDQRLAGQQALLDAEKYGAEMDANTKQGQAFMGLGSGLIGAIASDEDAKARTYLSRVRAGKAPDAPAAGGASSDTSTGLEDFKDRDKDSEGAAIGSALSAMAGGGAPASVSATATGSMGGGVMSDEAAKARAYLSGVEAGRGPGVLGRGVRDAADRQVLSPGMSESGLAKMVEIDGRMVAVAPAARGAHSDLSSVDVPRDAPRAWQSGPLGRVEDDARRKRRSQDTLVDEMNLDALRALEPDAYVYRPDAPGGDKGGRVQWGPMAQDLEKTPVGSSVVYDTPSGKIVDTKAATMQQYGMLAALAKRLDRVEGK